MMCESARTVALKSSKFCLNPKSIAFWNGLDRQTCGHFSFVTKIYGEVSSSNSNSARTQASLQRFCLVVSGEVYGFNRGG